MKYLLFAIFFFSSFVVCSSRPLTIMNESKISIDLILWKDSRVMFHQVLTPGSEIFIEDIGYGLLAQFKFVDCSVSWIACNHCIVLPSGYIEMELSDKHFNAHLYWFQPPVKVFSFNVHVTNSQPRA